MNNGCKIFPAKNGAKFLKTRLILTVNFTASDSLSLREKIAFLYFICNFLFW